MRKALAEPENVTAAVGYYRGVLTSLLGVPGAGPDPYQEATDSLGEVCKQPTLYVHGDEDGCVALDLVADAEEHLPTGSSMAVVSGAGHFCHLEKPDEVNELVIDWISQ